MKFNRRIHYKNNSSEYPWNSSPCFNLNTESRSRNVHTKIFVLSENKKKKLHFVLHPFKQIVKLRERMNFFNEVIKMSQGLFAFIWFEGLLFDKILLVLWMGVKEVVFCFGILFWERKLGQHQRTLSVTKAFSVICLS